MEQVKIGIMGLRRGASSISIMNNLSNAVVYAICDKDETVLNAAASRCPDGVLKFTDFDSFIRCGLDGVLLCNNFHEHAEFAIRALEEGVNVFSECTAAVTLKDCVRLCETVERTGLKYMLGENYPYQPEFFEAERLFQSGKMGKILYAEGEYNHTCNRDKLAELTPGQYHWRAWMPRTYYVTHTLGPLMYVTKETPITVSASAVHSDVLEEYDDFRHNYDAFSMMNCKTDGGALFRFTGCAHMGTPSGYRFCGERGGIETGRAYKTNVGVYYHPWLVPEGEETTQTYTPVWPENGEIGSHSGHGGSDFWMGYHFVNYIQNDIKPYFDVYRGCTMSAVAILGWYSCLNNGKTYKIPDFKNVEERNKYRDDALTPFPDSEGNGITLPCSTKDASLNWKSLVLPDYE